MKQRFALLLFFVASVCANKCTEGDCCDMKTLLLKPTNTPCATDPCREQTACTGNNPYCPTGGKMRTNGTACPEGICFNGKCKQSTVCVGDCCNNEKIAQLDGYPCGGGQCIDGKCKALPDCIGSCCDAANKAKEDGAICPEGNCMEGMCTNLNKRCAVGHCCDIHKKVLRPKGFKCTNNPCATKVECSGTSEFCPKATHYLVDGTPCPTGICMAGVCINEPFNATKAEEIRQQEHNGQVQAQQGAKTIVAGNLSIHHHHVSLPVCKTGACCDVKRQEVFEKGKNCTAKECFVGECDGQYSGCQYKPGPAGTPCKDGHCFDGVCIKECIGMCCEEDEVTPREDGSSCADGFCFKGACIKNCSGECCEPLKLFADFRGEQYRNERIGHKPNYGKFMQAKLDGSPCSNNNGYCMKGECTQFTVPAYRPKESDRPEIIPHDADVKLFSQSFRERFVKNFFAAAAKVENDKTDEEDLEYQQKKIAAQQEEAKKQRDARITSQAETEAALLAAANSTGSSNWYDKVFNRNVLFYCIIAIAVIAVIACIIKIATSRKSSKPKGNKYESLKKDEEENYNF